MKYVDDIVFADIKSKDVVEHCLEGIGYVWGIVVRTQGLVRYFLRRETIQR